MDLQGFGSLEDEMDLHTSQSITHFPIDTLRYLTVDRFSNLLSVDTPWVISQSVPLRVITFLQVYTSLDLCLSI